MLIRQFYTVRQTSSVANYIEKFELSINHLSSYSDKIHPFYFLTHFVEGLRKDIRAVVVVQRPPGLDTACALALLQEEVADGVFSALPRPPEPAPRAVFPIPPPPSRLVPPTSPSDWRNPEATRANNTKINALRDYRHARGLCFKCGEHWVRITSAPPKCCFKWPRRCSNSSVLTLAATLAMNITRIVPRSWPSRVPLSMGGCHPRHSNCWLQYKIKRSWFWWTVDFQRHLSHPASIRLAQDESPCSAVCLVLYHLPVRQARSVRVSLLVGTLVNSLATLGDDNHGFH